MQVPLEDGTFGYAKVLPHEVAFLNLRTETAEVSMEQLASVEIIFRIHVANYAFTRNSDWKFIGKGELSAAECEASKYFIRDSLTKKLRIYHESNEYPQGYKEWPATYEECIGLERAASWDPDHVASRLLDHFEDRENKWVKNIALDRD